MTVEKIESEGELLALVLRNSFNPPGLNFISDEEHTLQVGLHKRQKGHRYRAHVTFPFKEMKNVKPNKIYYVKKGKIGVDVYDKSDKKVSYVMLSEGDLIVFVSGGHGVDLLENGEFIEIKQGPYRGSEEDKRFLE